MLNGMWLPDANGSMSVGECIIFCMELLGRPSGEIQQFTVVEGDGAIEVMAWWSGAEGMLMVGLAWNRTKGDQRMGKERFHTFSPPLEKFCRATSLLSSPKLG
jgi:hypothetical protein